MRQHYHDQLDEIAANLVEMANLVDTAMSRATRSLLNSDADLAAKVVEDDDHIDHLAQVVEDTCVSVMALQSPVATELRFLIGAIRMSSSLERMGDLASHVAKQAKLRHPDSSIPAELRSTFSMMGAIANSVVQKTAAVISSRDLSLAADLAAADKQMDDLHRELFTVVLAPSWAHGVEAAVDVTLLSRYYERFADHGVTIARRIAYIVTGDMPDRETLVEGKD